MLGFEGVRVPDFKALQKKKHVAIPGNPFSGKVGR